MDEIHAKSDIYTIKTQLKYAYIYIYIYMFICTELIEETGRPPELIFGKWGYYWPGSDKFESCKKFTHLAELLLNCHFFEGVKNHINADISHPIRDRNAKTITICIFMLEIGWLPQISNMRTHH